MFLFRPVLNLLIKSKESCQCTMTSCGKPTAGHSESALAFCPTWTAASTAC